MYRCAAVRTFPWYCPPAVRNGSTSAAEATPDCAAARGSPKTSSMRGPCGHPGDAGDRCSTSPAYLGEFRGHLLRGGMGSWKDALQLSCTVLARLIMTVVAFITLTRASSAAGR